MYLEKTDYKTRIRMHLLDVLLESIADTEGETPAEILAAADKAAADTIKTKAGVLYAVAGEFEKSGTDRNGYILSLALSIALYEIYQRADDDQIPEKVIKNYDDAIETLNMVANGKEPLDLPPRVSEDGTPGGSTGTGEDAITSGVGLRRIGSAPKRTHRI